MTDEHDEPTPVGDAIPDGLAERLKAYLEAHPGIQGHEAPVSTRETPEEAAQRLERQREAVRSRWFRRLPVMYTGATGADLDEPLTIPTGTLNVALAGGVGTGKTHAAYAIGNDLVREGRLSVEAWVVADLLETLRPSKPGDDMDEQRRAIHWARRANVLILDDLGATKVSDWAMETLLAILDHRLREERVTILTTNLTEAQLEEAWGGRILDRLRFRRVVRVFKGESRRVGAW